MHDRHAIAVLALELADGRIGAAALSTDAAMALGECVARDLARIAPDASRFDLVFAAAHFDPAEALRPRWPLHQRLAELHARAPRDGAAGARIVAFGADAEGRVPLPLQADPALQGGPLRVLPLLLAGDGVEALQARLEDDLLDRGMASARTALLAQQAFDARVEHARLLTVHDLAAMMAMQYEHAGLGVLWPVIETALLAPEAGIAIDAPPEPRVAYADGVARIELASPARWQHDFAAGLDPESASRGYAAYEARLRQFSAVLAAHAIDAVFDYADD